MRQLGALTTALAATIGTGNGVLGVTPVVSPAPLPVDRTTVLVNLPIALAAAVLCIPILGRRLRIRRVAGGVLLLCFVACTLVTLRVPG